ncbi:MAG: ATP-binding protein [Lachnospiraceae bacterium]|nr:ATP-binding protein [Lachnospiraceae bacterium]
MKELTVQATTENIQAVTEFVDRELEALDCPMRVQMQIEIAIDELFGNIAHYAYAPETGSATVQFGFEEEQRTAVITFIDSGKPYDPLTAEEPDTTLSAEEREIGGLGIFLVKKTMDDISYEYKDGKNILHIRKRLI